MRANNHVIPFGCPTLRAGGWRVKSGSLPGDLLLSVWPQEPTPHQSARLAQVAASEASGPISGTVGQNPRI